MSVDTNTIAAVGSAVAAIAASVSAWLSYRTGRDASMPLLSVQPVPDEETGQLALVLHNSGGGAAIGVIAVSVVGDRYSTGGIEGGIVPAGHSRRVVTKLPAPRGWDEVTALAAYRTHRRRVHVVNTQGRHRRLSRRKSERGPYLRDLWKLAYPGTELPRPELKSGVAG